MSKEPKYAYDRGLGTLVEIEDCPVIWGIFSYGEGEDVTRIEGTSPFIFDSQKDMENYISSYEGNSNIEVLKNSNHLIVTRPFRMYKFTVST